MRVFAVTRLSVQLFHQHLIQAQRSCPLRQRTSVFLKDLRYQQMSDHADVRTKLSQYSGGSVDLMKDESTGIATLILNHPETKNAISGQMILQFENAITDLEDWNTGWGLIFTGAHGTFCSGGDLNFVRESLKSGDSDLTGGIMHDLTTRLRNLSMISVSLIQGMALGGGAELSTVCDFCLATEGAKIVFVHVKIGVIPGWGAVTRLVRSIGRRKALEILSSCKILSAQEAKDLGLVHDILPESSPDAVLAAAKSWLSQLCKTSDRHVIRSLKQAVVAADESNKSMRESLELEQELFASLWGKETHIRCLREMIK